MRAVVVGCGLIGSSVARKLADMGHHVLVVTRSEPAPPIRASLEDVEIVVLDVAPRAEVDHLFDECEHVFYCVGGLLPAESDLAPEIDAAMSLPPLLSVLEILRARPGIPITYTSSGGLVYGVPRHLPIDEDHPTDPQSPYGILKLTGEKYVQMYADRHGVPCRILRCSNVYGENQMPNRGQGVLGEFLHRIARGQPLPLFGDGSVVRDFVYVGDVADVMAKLADHRDGPRVLNVGSGVGTSLREVISLVLEVTGEPAVIDQRSTRSLDIPEVVLDPGRLRSMVDFEPLPLRVGVERVWDWVSTLSRASDVLSQAGRSPSS
jgi:UDP-glucose 4-epimerase